MERITIDLSNATSKDQIQDILHAAIPSPDFQGRNLDALNDYVSTMYFGTRVEVLLKGLDSLPSELTGYGNNILKIFNDAAASSCKISDSSFMMIRKV